MSQLGDVLFTETQRKLLSLLYGRPDRSYYLKELLRLTGMGVATIKRELDRMRAAGILRMNRIGNQHHYQADPQCPIHGELLTIVRKTLGFTEAIREALAPLADKIAWAFVFGSAAGGTESTGSDIDLMIIGEAEYAAVANALYPVQEALGREINPKIYRRDEWRGLLNSNDAFAAGVMARPRLDVMGSGDESR